MADIVIGGRLHSAATGNTVAGANEIMDDAQGKKQSVVNQETNERFNAYDTAILGRYTNEEINNLISNTPETDVIVVDIPAASQSDIAGWLDANTPSGTDPETGKSVRANKLYRVPGPDNTTYSEWGWDGTAYIMLANKDYGIDNVPTAGSDNLVKSGGVYANYLQSFIAKNDTSAGIFWYFTDLFNANDRILLRQNISSGTNDYQDVFVNNGTKLQSMIRGQWYLFTKDDYTNNIEFYLAENVSRQFDFIANPVIIEKFLNEPVMIDAMLGFDNALPKHLYYSASGDICIKVNNGSAFALFPVVEQSVDLYIGKMLKPKSSDYFRIDGKLYSYNEGSGFTEYITEIKDFEDQVITASAYGYINEYGNITDVGNSSTDSYINDDYIKVLPGDRVHISSGYLYNNDSWSFLWGYSDKNGSNPVKITGAISAGNFSATVIIPEGVKYIRFWGGVAYNPTLTIFSIFNRNTNIKEFENQDFIPNRYGYINDQGTVSMIDSPSTDCYVTIDQIPVHSGCKVKIETGYPYNNDSWSFLWGYDKNDSNPVKLSGNVSAGIYENTITIPEGVAFVRFWGGTTYNPKLTVLSVYESAGKNKSTNDYDIVVAKDGSGDFTELYDALRASEPIELTKHVTIFIKPGRYEMGSSHNTGSPSNRNVSIIGCDKNSVVVYNTNGEYIEGDDNSCLRLAGNVTIKNLTLRNTHENYSGSGTPGAYCIHVDFDVQNGTVTEIDNCDMYDDHYACIGIGLRDNFTLRIKNCSLYSHSSDAVAQQGWNGAIICHDGNQTGVGQKIEMISNIIECTGKYAIAITSAFNKSMDALFIGNAIFSGSNTPVNLGNTTTVNSKTCNNNIAIA